MKKRGKAASSSMRYMQKIEELEKKMDAPQTAETIKGWLRTCAHFHQYSMNNTFWLYAQSVARGTQISHVAAFSKWKELKNAAGESSFVKKGEKGYTIIYPMVHKCYELDENGKYKRDASGNPIVKVDEKGKEMTYLSYGVGYVFDVDQTTAREIGAYTEPPLYGKEVNVTPELVEELSRRITTKLNIPVTFKDSEEQAGGWYNRKEHSITINTRETNTPTRQLSVLMHELGHAVMHNAKCRGEELSRELKEGQAEAFAYAASSFFGVEPPSELYIKGWISDKVPLTDVMRNIGRTIKETFNDLDMQKLIQQQSIASEQTSGQSMGVA